MASSSNFIQDLAKITLKRLQSRRDADVAALPKSVTLNQFLRTIYAVSLKTEEGQPVRLSVALMNPGYWFDEGCAAMRTARKLGRRMAVPRLVYFREWLPFEEETLKKLALASDPLGAVVCAGSNQHGDLVIFGLFDQILHYNRFLQRQTKQTAAVPGELLSTIEGVGRISVYRQGQFIAGVEHTTLIKKISNPLSEGPIREALTRPLDHHINSNISLNAQVHDLKLGRFTSNLRLLLFHDWIDIICRVVNKVRDYAHGGALIITPKGLHEVDVKYPINYDRLPSAFLRMCSDRIGRELAIFGAERHNKDLPFPRDRVSESYRVAESELEGAIAFIASLTRVDGAVFSDPKLNVLGFGAVIMTKRNPPKPHLAQDAAGQRLSCAEINLGTRHRSVMRYCWSNPGSIGFVLSHDGELRIVARLNDKLIIWERVDIRQFWSPRF